MLDALVTHAVYNSVPLRTRFGSSQMDPEIIPPDHHGFLQNWTQKNAIGSFDSFQLQCCRKAEAFAQRLGEDDTTRLVHTQFHAMNYGIWRGSMVLIIWLALISVSS